MNILFLQDHLRSGGAARAAGRWADLLRGEGHRVIQAAGDEAGPDAVQLTGKPARGRGRIREIFTGNAGRKAAVEVRLGEFLRETKPDRIWFHNIAGGGKWGWSEEMVRIARNHAPVLWTLHDMWALGERGESYWEEGSAVGSGRLKGEGGKNSRVERVCGANGKYPVRLTAPSKWLAQLTQRMTGVECVHLPNPIDLAVFSPGDRTEARRQLGLPEKAWVVLAGADSLQDARKGFDLLLAAWEQLRPQGVTLALFGRHGESRPGQVYLGNLVSDAQMVAAYRAADLYVHPARMENAPCTIQESLCCGTPVLAFAVGGIPEMVRPGEDGFLVEKVNEVALAESLRTALRNPGSLEKIRPACRSEVCLKYAATSLLKRLSGLDHPICP